jgi:hypothetical protein
MTSRLSFKEEFSDAKLDDGDAADFYIARQILQEIRNFGVNQRTTVKLIELLALELESREKMLAIVEAIKAGPSILSDSPVIER